MASSLRLMYSLYVQVERNEDMSVIVAFITSYLYYILSLSVGEMHTLYHSYDLFSYLLHLNFLSSFLLRSIHRPEICKFKYQKPSVQLFFIYA